MGSKSSCTPSPGLVSPLVAAVPVGWSQQHQCPASGHTGRRRHRLQHTQPEQSHRERRRVAGLSPGSWHGDGAGDGERCWERLSFAVGLLSEEEAPFAPASRCSLLRAHQAGLWGELWDRGSDCWGLSREPWVRSRLPGVLLSTVSISPPLLLGQSAAQPPRAAGSI